MFSDLKTFSNTECKIAAEKGGFWANFSLLSRIFLVSVFLTLFNGLFAPVPEVQCPKCFHLFTPFRRLFTPLPKVQYPNVLDFQNPLGKVMERSDLDLTNFAHKGCKSAAKKNDCRQILPY